MTTSTWRRGLVRSTVAIEQHLFWGGSFMRRIGLGLFALAMALTVAASAQAQNWGAVKGQVVWADPVPKQPKIVPGVNQDVCAKDKEPLEEDFIVNPANKGLKNVFVWIRPEGAKKNDPFPTNLIKPELLKPAKPDAMIDQPCCRFIPHVLAARAGQNMIIKNTAPIAHNAKWSSVENGEINPLIAAGTDYKLAKPLVFEGGEITLQCSLHSWMKAHVRVFDHPYYAITDADGKFEIKDAPAGKFSLYISHPANGWLNGKEGRNGTPIAIVANTTTDLGAYKMKKND
jgi:hypothetical protein